MRTLGGTSELLSAITNTLSHSDFSIPLSLLGFNVLLLCVIHRRLMVKHIRTLQLDEDVLCVRYSPDQRLLAVSLLDCTVKIFYTDTLKVNHKHSIALQYFPHTTTHSIMLNPYINALCKKNNNINSVQQKPTVLLELHLLRDIFPPTNILTLYADRPGLY